LRRQALVGAAEGDLRRIEGVRVVIEAGLDVDACGRLKAALRPPSARAVASIWS
jgi:hypothetical protein